MTLGPRVKRLRVERHLSREQLAVASGVSMGTIENVENDHVVTIATVQKVAAGLRVPMAHLFD
jgi:transcriptional regulator with XRE-family HTH domain